MSTLLKVSALIFGILGVLVVHVDLSFLHLYSLRWIRPGWTALMVSRGRLANRIDVPLSRISGPLKQAVITAEDGRFYRHGGVDFHEMRESIKKNRVRGRYVRGFSTITMQVAKNLYLPPHKTLSRKAAEIFIAWHLERKLSKDRILEIYLNVIEWGEGLYGVEAAARYYFKKSAAALSADEAAFLAAILPNPRKWGHWPPGPYVQRRKEVILARMGMRASPQRKLPELPELPELPDPPPPEPLPPDL